MTVVAVVAVVAMVVGLVLLGLFGHLFGELPAACGVQIAIFLAVHARRLVLERVVVQLDDLLFGLLGGLDRLLDVGQGGRLLVGAHGVPSFPDTSSMTPNGRGLPGMDVTSYPRRRATPTDSET